MGALQSEWETALQDYNQFCQESMQWCAVEAEHSATAIIHAIEVLLKNNARVSLMSVETIETLRRIRQVDSATGASTIPVDEVIKSIRRLVGRDAGVTEQLSQIVEALQFQDKVRQNMENLAKICGVWFQYRAGILASPLSEDELEVDLGKKLFACTTMKEERDLIRAEFAGLPDDDIYVAGDSLFF